MVPRTRREKASEARAHHAYLYLQQTPTWVCWDYGNHSSGGRAREGCNQRMPFYQCYLASSMGAVRAGSWSPLTRTVWPRPLGQEGPVSGARQCLECIHSGKKRTRKPENRFPAGVQKAFSRGQEDPKTRKPVSGRASKTRPFGWSSRRHMHGIGSLSIYWPFCCIMVLRIQPLFKPFNFPRIHLSDSHNLVVLIWKSAWGRNGSSRLWLLSLRFFSTFLVRRPFSVSRWSANLGTGKADVHCNDGGLLCLLLLLKVGCSIFWSVMICYLEEQPRSRSDHWLLDLVKQVQFSASLWPICSQSRYAHVDSVCLSLFKYAPTTPKTFFLSTNGSALAVKSHQHVQVIQVIKGNSWSNTTSSGFLRNYFCVHVTTVCFQHKSHWLLSRVQGCCLELKWQWPFWYSAAPFRTSSCVHPIDGVVGSCGSAQPFRYQHSPSVPQRSIRELEYCLSVLGLWPFHSRSTRHSVACPRRTYQTLTSHPLARWDCGP